MLRRGGDRRGSPGEGAAAPHQDVAQKLNAILRDLQTNSHSRHQQQPQQQRQAAPGAAAPLEPSPAQLEQYLAPYRGDDRVHRLLHIANNGPAGLVLPALRGALTLIKQGYQRGLYEQVLKGLDPVLAVELGPLAAPDEAWMRNRTMYEDEHGRRLEAQYERQKSEGESHEIAAAALRLAEFRASLGDYAQALSLLGERRGQVRANPVALLENRLLSLEAAILANRLASVNSEVRQIVLPAKGGDPVLQSKLAAALALACIGGRSSRAPNLRQAALELLRCDVALGEHWAQVICLRDVAIYVCLGALQHFSRAQIRDMVLRNPQFKKFLELVPELHRVLEHYYRSEYRECFAELERLKPLLKLDMYVGRAVEAIVGSIRDNALCLYFQPFVAVHLPQMAEAFDMRLPELEAQLLRLINSRRISGRIDAAQKILYSRVADERSLVFQRSLAQGDAYLREVRSLLLRMSLAEHQLLVKRDEDEAEGSGRGGPGSGSGLNLDRLMRR